MIKIRRRNEEMTEKGKNTTAYVRPFITLGGTAEEAINYYVSVFPDSEVVALTRIEEGMPGKVGDLLTGVFSIREEEIMVMNMEKEQAPAPSWMITLLIMFPDEAEFDEIFQKLSTGGVVMMGPEPVMDMRKVAWVTDKFGVTWQLVFA
jgi:predicted 3-demethylubiquinone-9 3-methyltransferase (glyoxalase superfamily)